MDFETPVDAWYVWVGVATVSVVFAGLAVQLPIQPPPDATEAVNTIDRVASSTHHADATYDHDAERVKIDTTRVSLRNDGGTTHASIAFGSMTPLAAIDDEQKQEALDRILSGQQPSEVLEDYSFDERALVAAALDARARRTTEQSKWRPASGVLRVRKIELDGETLLLVDA
jgi:uncharacterized cupredoxin-like copper-binding protein